MQSSECSIKTVKRAELTTCLNVAIVKQQLDTPVNLMFALSMTLFLLYPTKGIWETRQWMQSARNDAIHSRGLGRKRGLLLGLSLEACDWFVSLDARTFAPGNTAYDRQEGGDQMSKNGLGFIQCSWY